MDKQFTSFSQFYPFYLLQHSNITCRRLHFIGSVLALLLLFLSLLLRHWWPLLLTPIVGYGFAWWGHWRYEKNRPATFQYPWYSLLGDWCMFRDIINGKIKF